MAGGGSCAGRGSFRVPGARALAPDSGAACLTLGCAVAGVGVVARAGPGWPQAPAGLSFCGSAPPRPVPPRPCGSPIGLKRRPGCEGRGSFPAWVGRGRAGVPPHKLQGAGSVASRRPCVQFAAGAPRPVPALPFRRRRSAGGRDEDRSSPMDLCGRLKQRRWSLWRSESSVTALSALRRLAAYETVGWGRVGVPPQQTAHTAVLLQLTPHLAVCEEVPRRGPAPPTYRRNREPLQPGRRLRPVSDRHGRDGRQPTARPALEATTPGAGAGKWPGQALLRAGRASP